MVMIKLNISQIKASISDYVPALLKGKKIILCRRNEPIAEIIGLGPTARETGKKREIGFAAGRFKVDDSFFEPLSDAELALFEGGEE